MPEDDRVELIVKYHGDLPTIAGTLGAEAELLFQGYAIITIDRDRIPELYSFPQIENIELPKLLSFEQSNTLVTTCVKNVQSSPLWDLRGQGVLVAVIDSGLDYQHPDFRNEDGTSRVRYVWDQTATSGHPPKGFVSGAEYDKTELDAALASSDPLRMVPFVDTNGHGTAVTGIAAGNGRAKPGSALGVAPEADIISVKLGTRGYASFARTTELMRAIKYVIEKARLLEEPVAINISVGMNNGSHRGDSLFESFIDASAAEWKNVIVIPTGNEGGAAHHFEGTIATGETKEIDFFVAGGIQRFFVTLWKDFADTFSVELILPNGRSSGLINVDNQVKVFRDDNLEVKVLYGQPNHYSLAQQISFDVEAIPGTTISSGLWKIMIQGHDIVNGQIDAWLPTLEVVSNQTFFASPSSVNTLTIPSTANKVITVAGYSDRTDSVLDFSGKGPVNTPFRNPDLAAPASNILAPSIGGSYDSFTGTSFAAPFVTGASALMMQWGIVRKNDPFLYGQRVKAFLRLGAKRSPNRTYPNISWGYGTLCLERSMEFLKKYKLGGGKEFWTSM